MFTLLYVTQGEKTLINEKPLWLIPASISAVNSLISVEKPCATNVAPLVNATSNGFNDGSIAPPGVDFVINPAAERGDV
ncbi:hypothetical protein D9M71_591270 [compost metagenome]